MESLLPSKFRFGSDEGPRLRPSKFQHAAEEDAKERKEEEKKAHPEKGALIKMAKALRGISVNYVDCPLEYFRAIVAPRLLTTIIVRESKYNTLKLTTRGVEFDDSTERGIIIKCGPSMFKVAFENKVDNLSQCVRVWVEKVDEGPEDEPRFVKHRVDETLFCLIFDVNIFQ